MALDAVAITLSRESTASAVTLDSDATQDLASLQSFTLFFLKKETINTFNKRYFSEENVRRGLGFDKPQLNPEVKATCGCVSDDSFGHSGFTGTYTWADPASGIVYVFLSNRVYPTMNNDGLIKTNMRTEIQQIIQDAIIH